MKHMNMFDIFACEHYTKTKSKIKNNIRNALLKRKKVSEKRMTTCMRYIPYSRLSIQSPNEFGTKSNNNKYTK